LILLLKKRRRISDLHEEKQFLSIFGTFFYEFKSNGLNTWLFYLIFAFRRFAIIFFIIFTDSPTLQLTVHCVFSLSIILYLLLTRAFRSKISSCYIILNEILTVIYFFIYLLSNLSLINLSSLQIASYSIKLVLCALCLSCFSSLCIFINKLIEYIKQRIAKRKQIRQIQTTTKGDENNSKKLMINSI
jgi:hypothetical protein